MKLLLLTLLCSVLTLNMSHAGKKAGKQAGKPDESAAVAKLEKQFAKLDKNSDGQISKEEFVNRKHKKDGKKDKAAKQGKKGKKAKKQK